MKKLIYWIGTFATVAALFAAFAVMLKKLKISLSIEGIDDTLGEEEEEKDIDVSFESEESEEPEAEDGGEAEQEDAPFAEAEKTVEEAVEDMLKGEDAAEKEIEVEILAGDDGPTA